MIPTILAATLAAAGFLMIAAFQLLLALGAPLGRAAYGGRSAELSPAFRRASVGAVVIWLIAAVVILGAGNVTAGPLPEVRAPGQSYRRSRCQVPAVRSK